MLSAELALGLQPVVEEVWACLDDFESLERDVVVALGLVVGVDGLEVLVEDVGEGLDVGRFLAELYEPLVAASGLIVHINRCGGVFGNYGTGLLAGVGESFLGVVHDEFLAESVDEVFCPARDDELIRIAAREAYRVADFVSPQSARRADEHGIVLSELDAAEGHDVRVARSYLVDGQELVEYAVVEHQEHALVGRVVLYAEETLAGVVGFHVVHLIACYDLLVLLAVGREGYSPVEEYLEVRPYVLDVLLSRNFENAHEHGEHPRRYAGDVCDVLVHRLAGNPVAFHLEVADEGCSLLRHPDEFG